MRTTEPKSEEKVTINENIVGEAIQVQQNMELNNTIKINTFVILYVVIIVVLIYKVSRYF